MKLHNGVIYGATTALDKLVSQDWPVKNSLALVKLHTSMKVVFDCIEKVRSGLVLKYEKEKGAGMSEANPNWDKFVNDYTALMEDFSEIKFEKIQLPLKVNGKDVMIKPQEIQALEQFIEFKEN
jgi:hypothetical protein